MRLTEAALPVFARHETFHPRYGWFRKAYRAVVDDPHVFECDDAPVRIGVGKNMVRSIRFWGLAAGLFAETRGRRHRGTRVPTEFADRLFGDEGWDPWMEDPGTLWLLHWRLLRPPCQLPVWWLAFHDFHAVEFESSDLEDAVAARLADLDGWRRPSPSALRKDVSALLRTYAPVERRGRTSIDDALDCPLRELELLARSPQEGRYRFRHGDKPLLPPEVLVYTALDYAAQTRRSGSTIPLVSLVHEPGSPGRAFRLTEAEFASALEPAVAATEGLGLTSSAGDFLFSWSEPPRTLANRVLDTYYGAGR